MTTEKQYSIIEDGQKMVKALVEMYPEVLWQVRPHQVAVLGVENKEPTKRSPDYRIRGIKNVEKAILKLNKIDTRFAIEIFYSDWNEWDTPRREWTILNALLRISVEEGKMIRPDCVEFKIVLDKVGFDWNNPEAALPSLTATKMDFDLDLRPGLEEEEDDEPAVVSAPPASETANSAIVS